MSKFRRVNNSRPGESLFIKPKARALAAPAAWQAWRYICGKWRLTSFLESRLIGAPAAPTLFRWRKAPWTAPSLDTLERVRLLMAIDAMLPAACHEAQTRLGPFDEDRRWLVTALALLAPGSLEYNPPTATHDSTNETPLSHMARGSLSALVDVHDLACNLTGHKVIHNSFGLTAAPPK